MGANSYASPDQHAAGADEDTDMDAYDDRYTFDGRNRNLNTITVSVAYTDSNGSNAGNYTITGASSWPAPECAATRHPAA